MVPAGAAFCQQLANLAGFQRQAPGMEGLPQGYLNGLVSIPAEFNYPCFCPRQGQCRRQPRRLAGRVNHKVTTGNIRFSRESKAQPLGHRRLGIPNAIDRCFHIGGQYRPGRRHCGRQRNNGLGRHGVTPLVRVKAEHRLALQTGWPIKHLANTGVAILNRPGEIAILKRRPHMPLSPPTLALPGSTPTCQTVFAAKRFVSGRWSP